MRTPFVHANEYSHGNHSRRSVIRSPVIDRNPAGTDTGSTGHVAASSE